MKIIFAIFLFHQTLNVSVDFRPAQPTCNQKLVRSFGLQGFEEPQQIEFLMCPSIENSCCTTYDQEEIYSQWVINKQREELNERFEFYGQVYNRLLKKGVTFHELLLKIIKQMKIKSFSNCKIIASRLAQFQFKSISEQLQEAIKNMYLYYRDIYKGFFCTICDANSQSFFRPDKKVVQYQKKFCRDIISQSLNVLLYLHINLKKYFNLATRFISNCDFEGNYTKKDSEDSFIFQFSKENLELLSGCKAYRNEVFWMEYCEPICKKFNLFNLDEFFTPDLKQFAYYNKFFSSGLEQLQEQQKLAEKKQKKQDQKQVRELTDSRILEEQKDKQQEEEDQDSQHKDDSYYMELVDSYLEQPIYYEPSKIPYEISEFDSVFAESDIGIDMTVIGKKTDISEKIRQFIEAKKVAEAQKLIKQKNQQMLEEEAIEQEEENKKEEQKSKTDKQKKSKDSINMSISNSILSIALMFINFYNQLHVLIIFQISNINKKEYNSIVASIDLKNKNPIKSRTLKIKQNINLIFFQNNSLLLKNCFLKYKQQKIQIIIGFALGYLFIVLGFM